MCRIADVILTLDIALLLERTLIRGNIQNSLQIRLIRGFVGVWGRKMMPWEHANSPMLQT